MRAAVIGAGIIGLACAEELIRAGHDVRVFDPTPAQGATHAAAGMLAPAGEAWHGEESLLRLGLASAARWPEYAARLRAQSGIDVDLRTFGTVLAGRDHDDLQVVRRTLELLESQGIPFEHLDRRGLLWQEPALSTRVAGGALLPEDHNVNPRRVAAALIGIVGQRLVRRAASATDEGVVLRDGTTVTSDVVIVATGATSGEDSDTRYVRPVKGEIVRARMDDPPGRVVRARVYGESVYVVPRADNEVLIGATEEEKPGDPVPTVGGVTRLLNAARALVPGLETAEILDITARHRPGTPDNGPVLGPVGTEPGATCPRIIATGHYRGGVLLAPLTAQVVRAYVEGTAVPEEALPFTPDRFAPEAEQPEQNTQKQNRRARTA